MNCLLLVSEGHCLQLRQLAQLRVLPFVGLPRHWMTLGLSEREHPQWGAVVDYSNLSTLEAVEHRRGDRVVGLAIGLCIHGVESFLVERPCNCQSTLRTL